MRGERLRAGRGGRLRAGGWRELRDVGAKRLAELPSGRFATAEEVAASVVFLMTDAAALYHGQTLNPNGGGYMP